MVEKFINYFSLPSTPLFGDSRSALEQAISQVDKVITVSPSYAKALLNPHGHAYTDSRITDALKKKGVEGILNVLGQDRADTTRYNNLVTFTATDAADGKAINKQSLQKRFNLPLSKEAFLVTMMARLVKQKSISEVIDAAKLLFQGTEQLPIQLLLVGSADDQTRTSLKSLMKRSPNIIFIDRFVEGEDRELILRGSDAMLMPSLFEPCGMIALECSQFGTIPIYTPIEGFHDSVIPFDGKQNGYGIQVEYPPTGQTVFNAITAAHSLFVTPTWNLLITNAMAQHWAWDSEYDKYFGV
ncbi:MAG: glycogen synthase [Synechococcaceae cyanobacterium SM1_2_3]|nr:glycogen synthase [Synechococcaceae cyanobacterium SM1_2_3]